MDATSFVSRPGVPTNVESFLNTIRAFPRTAWNCFPSRHYFGMMTVEQVDGGWKVYIAPNGAGEKVNEAFYTGDDEQRLGLEVARKMHPTLICVCASPHACFAAGCRVQP